MIKFNCPSCGKRLGVPDKFAGKKVKCPKCTQIIVVPVASNHEGIPLATPVKPSTAPRNIVPLQTSKAMAILVVFTVFLIGIVLGALAVFVLFTPENPPSNPPDVNETTETGNKKELLDNNTTTSTETTLTLESMEAMSAEQLQQKEREIVELFDKTYSSYRIRLENMTMDLKRLAAREGGSYEWEMVNNLREMVLGMGFQGNRRFEYWGLFSVLLKEDDAKWYERKNIGVLYLAENLTLEVLRVKAGEIAHLWIESWRVLTVDLPSRSPIGALAITAYEAYEKAYSTDERNDILVRTNKILEKGGFEDETVEAFRKFLAQLKQNSQPG